MGFKRIITSSVTSAAALALFASTALAAVGTQNPNLTVSLTLSPTTVTIGDTITGTGSVINNTNKTARVQTKVEITSPSGVVSTYTEKYVLGPGQTVTETVTYTPPADAQLGTYTVTLSATDKKGTSHATEYVTVQ